MKDEKFLHWILIIFSFFFLFPQVLFAQSSYVLPYPSFMPGSKLYLAHQTWRKVMQYWYFGDFSQFKYNLEESDRYLVEAKILFEYKQYLLGYQALKKSDNFFSKAPPFRHKAKQEGKNTDEKQEILNQASLKHIEVLENLQVLVPERFVWEPEKDSPTDLLLQASINNSISIRNKWLKK